VRVVAVRDELYSRQTLAPAAHWHDRDRALVGPLDVLAGGAPLAVHRERCALAILVNAPPHQWERRPGDGTRGMLPLLAASGERIAPAQVCDLPGFHLLCATVDRRGRPLVELSSWDGVALTHTVIEPGDHVLTSAGIDVPGHERGDRVRRALGQVPCSEPVDSPAWRALAATAVVADQELSGGLYGTVGAAAITLSPSRIGYAVCARPGRSGWVSVLPSRQGDAFGVAERRGAGERSYARTVLER
jgi:hypothetical protein